MNAPFAAMLVLLAALQYPLWFGHGGMAEYLQLRRAIATQQVENERLRERAVTLAAEVADLKHGLSAVEERARAELGMIRRGETFYQIVTR
jgi:cell division protein FtsB